MTRKDIEKMASKRTKTPKPSTPEVDREDDLNALMRECIKLTEDYKENEMCMDIPEKGEENEMVKKVGVTGGYTALGAGIGTGTAAVMSTPLLTGAGIGASIGAGAGIVRVCTSELDEESPEMKTAAFVARNSARAWYGSLSGLGKVHNKIASLFVKKQ